MSNTVAQEITTVLEEEEEEGDNLTEVLQFCFIVGFMSVFWVASVLLILHALTFPFSLHLVFLSSVLFLPLPVLIMGIYRLAMEDFESEPPRYDDDDDRAIHVKEF